MSDAKKRLANAMDARSESYEDRQAREAQERDEARAYFEQTIVPGFEAAAAEIIKQAAVQQSKYDPLAYADVDRGSLSEDGMYADLTVRRGMEAEFWFRGIARMRTLPVDWKYRRNRRIKNDGTLTSEGTEKELKWPVSMAETTTEQIRDDPLTRYAEVVDVLNRQRR